MSERILLVQNDNLPRITVDVKNDADGTAANLTGASAVLHFRQKATGTVLSIPCDITGSTVAFEFPNGALAVPGDYEGEIEFDFVGKKQTLQRPLKFKVRSQFA